MDMAAHLSQDRLNDIDPRLIDAETELMRLRAEVAHGARTPGSSKGPCAVDDPRLPHTTAPLRSTEHQTRAGRFQYSGAAGVRLASVEEKKKRAAAIEVLLHEKYFAPHIREGGEEPNAECFGALIKDRAEALEDRGVTRASIETAFSKVRRMDMVAAALRGALGSLFFNIAGYLNDNTAIVDVMVAALDHVPALRHLPHSVKVGFVGGAFAGAADEFLAEVLEHAMEHTHHLYEASVQLEDVMRDAKKQVKASLARALLEHGFAIQSFRIRDLLRIAATALGASPQAASALGAAMGVVSGGAGFVFMLYLLDDWQHRTGAAYVLARRDVKVPGETDADADAPDATDPAWLKDFETLQAATWTGAFANAVGRVVQAIIDTPAAVLSAPHILTSPRPAMKAFVALGLGSSFSSYVASIVQEATKDESPEVSTLKANLAQCAANSVVGLAWITATLTTDKLVDAFRKVNDEVGNRARQGVSRAVQGGVSAVTKGMTKGAQTVWSTASDLTGRAARATDNLGTLRLRRPQSRRYDSGDSSIQLTNLGSPDERV